MRWLARPAAEYDRLVSPSEVARGTEDYLEEQKEAYASS